MKAPNLKRETRYGLPEADHILYNRYYTITSELIIESQRNFELTKKSISVLVLIEDILLQALTK